MIMGSGKEMDLVEDLDIESDLDQDDDLDLGENELGLDEGGYQEDKSYNLPLNV